jgi:hypothetical protein
MAASYFLSTEEEDQSLDREIHILEKIDSGLKELIATYKPI